MPLKSPKSKTASKSKTDSKIYLIGTSSAGKTSLTNEFPADFERIRIDDYYDQYYNECRKTVMKRLKNAYLGPSALEQEIWKEFDKIFFKKIQSAKKAVIDDVSLNSLDAIHNRKKRRVYLIYAPFKDMVRNIQSRKISDPRDLRAFEHLTYFYRATCDSKKAIDVIRRPQILKEFETIRWLFDSESHMRNFVIDICQKMGIVSDEPYMIKPIHNVYDKIINTKGKSPSAIVSELGYL